VIHHVTWFTTLRGTLHVGTWTFVRSADQMKWKRRSRATRVRVVTAVNSCCVVTQIQRLWFTRLHQPNNIIASIAHCCVQVQMLVQPAAASRWKSHPPRLEYQTYVSARRLAWKLANKMDVLEFVAWIRIRSWGSRAATISRDGQLGFMDSALIRLYSSSNQCRWISATQNSPTWHEQARLQPE
jgi:hypothetical protein